MPSQKDYILQLNQYIKLDNMLHINYADILIKKTGGCPNNPEKSLTTKNRRTYSLLISDVNYMRF